MSLFYEKVQKDSLLGPYFQGKDIKKIVNSQFECIASVLGAPKPWRGNSLEHIHCGCKISDQAFDRYIYLFRESAIEIGKVREADGLYNALNRFRNKVVDINERNEVLDAKTQLSLKQNLHNFFWNKDNSSLKKIFKIFDRRGTSHVSINDMMVVFKSLFTDYVDPIQIYSMIQEADIDKNGTIEFNEFQEIMNK